MLVGMLTRAEGTSHSGEVTVQLDGVLDLPRTLGILQRGTGDPALQIDAGTHTGGPSGTPGAGAWWVTQQYDDAGNHLGASTLRLDQLSSSEVRVRAVAETRVALEQVLAGAPQMLGSADNWSAFEALLHAQRESSGPQRHLTGQLLEVRRRHPGVRLPATGALFEQLCTVVLEQKVTHDQARHSWRKLLQGHGDVPPASPGLPTPSRMRLPPTPQQLREVASWQWHQMWVQPALATTTRQVAERAPALHRLAATDLGTDSVAQLAEKLTSIPGIGRWSAAETLQRTHGASDLVSVGDYHLAHFVGEALTGRRTDDDGMLKLLEPYRPHRQRLVRLLGLTGFRQQRFGPKLAPADHRQR